VAENIAASTIIEEDRKIVNWNRMRAIAQKAIDRVDRNLKVNARLGSLSIAKQQLVAIARALVCDAKLVILDEPTSSLSVSEVDSFFKILDDLKSQGISVLFISHKLDEVFHVTDRMTVLRDGQYMGTYNTAEMDRQRVISLMVGRNVVFERKENPGVSDRLLLEVKNISKKGNYKDISFKLNQGEILGITGLVGAGRTEVCETLFGISERDSGEVLLENRPVNFKNTSQAVEAGMAFVPENRQLEGLVLANTVEENITLNVLNKLTGAIKTINGKLRRKKTMEYIDMLKVRPPYPDMYANKLSGGNQQRVVLAKWVAANPKVLIIDEPTNGVDVGAKEEIHNILRDLARRGIGIIMVSSELPEVLAVSDRILVMRRGRIMAEFKGAEATQELIMNEALL
jgi:ABC-type sugar transport system ATPase subunit